MLKRCGSFWSDPYFLNRLYVSSTPLVTITPNQELCLGYEIWLHNLVIFVQLLYKRIYKCKLVNLPHVNSSTFIHPAKILFIPRALDGVLGNWNDTSHIYP